jgi:hypothetical protein
MGIELYNWLKYQWKLCNLPKYQKYFTVWVDNLTENQIEGFTKGMNQDLTKQSNYGKV